MVKYLIQRPIAVLMAFTAVFILSIITYLNMPVSLLPDIAIPEISVHIVSSQRSAREIENTVVAPLCRQLLQTGKLRDIQSETRDGSAVIRIKFEYGADTDLAFIEVNEKIDAAMGQLPRDMERPRVVKASASDIPIFMLNINLKNRLFSEDAFLDLSELVENVIRRRIEQLPQVSMADMTGLMRKQVLIQPDFNVLKTTGITLSEIEAVLSANNIEPGSATVTDGYYEYNIRFSAVMRTIADMENIYIRKNDKIYQFRDIASVKITAENESGMYFYNGQRAIALAIIKQSDENMANLKLTMSSEIDRLQKSYPDIEFNISQNQTELLDYTISNLQQNLLLAFLFILLVSIFFMKDFRSPFITGLAMFVSLCVSVPFFYLFDISLNVVSLTGLILALGMMIDNSIIVTDNIGQYRKMDYSIDEACVKGTNEVITPILSSSFTNIAVFVPLIFMSGIAGALFFDQAFSVTAGLLVSYVVAIILLPVSYKLIFSRKIPFLKYKEIIASERPTIPLLEKIYNRGIKFVFSHKTAVTMFMIAVLPLGYLIFKVIPKEKMPKITQTELVLNIDWNENINLNENNRRTLYLIEIIGNDIISSAIKSGRQQFLVENSQNTGPSETEVYLKFSKSDSLPMLKQKIEEFFAVKYPLAIFSFSPPTTIFDRVFDTGEAEVVADFYSRNRNNKLKFANAHYLQEKIVRHIGIIPKTIPFEKQLNFILDREKIILYDVSYNDIYQALRTGFGANKFSVLRSYQQYLPVVLGKNSSEMQKVLDETMIPMQTDNSGEQRSLPLSTFVSITHSEDFKNIVAGKNGECLPFYFYQTHNSEQIINKLEDAFAGDSNYELQFGGSYFFNRKMINEFIVILLISILLMYFILAAQFESFLQPLIVMLEIPIDIVAILFLLMITGHSINLMSSIGIVVACGIIINDSILKIDIMNRLRKSGFSLMDAIHTAGSRRLNAILMTSLTTIVCMLPLLFSNDLGSELEKPLALATIGGMLMGTPVSLFVVPLVYWAIYQKSDKDKKL